MPSQNLTDDKTEIVAYNPQRDSPRGAHVDNAGETSVDRNTADKFSQLIRVDSKIADLKRKAFGRGEFPALPIQLPFAPLLRRREAFDHSVENVANRNGVVEINKQHALFHASHFCAGRCGNEYRS